MLISNVEKTNFKEICVEVFETLCVSLLSLILLFTLMFF